MPRFAANLSMMYHEHAFLDRFAAAAADGFRAVEFLFPYEHAAAELRARLERERPHAGTVQRRAGRLGSRRTRPGRLPGGEADFRGHHRRALGIRRVIGNDRIHVMAGLIPADADRARCRATYLENLAFAAKAAAAQGVTVLIEPINPRDMPGYFLNRQDDGQAICKEVARPT